MYKYIFFSLVLSCSTLIAHSNSIIYDNSAKFTSDEGVDDDFNEDSVDEEYIDDEEDMGDDSYEQELDAEQPEVDPNVAPSSPGQLRE